MLVVTGVQWLALGITGHPGIPPAVIIGCVFALVLGVITLIFGRTSSEESLRAENAELKAKVEDKNNAAIMRDGIIKANEGLIEELKAELAQWRSGRNPFGPGT